MDLTNVNIVVKEGAKIPEYATPGSAGFDLVANSFDKVFKGNKEVDIAKLAHSIAEGKIMLRPYERVLIGTGLFMEIPEGFELQIRPRSGISLKRGLTVLNSPGTIDSDYRNEIGIILYNSTQFLAEIHLGEAVAQGVLARHEKASFNQTAEVKDTERKGGFGSTDKIEPLPMVAKFV